MVKRLLVDAVHPEEIRVALADESKLIEFEFESAEKKQIKSNIYLGKITRVEPSLQAAFVEYGGNRQGFLPFSEIHYDYFQIPMEDKEKIARIIESENSRVDEDDEDDLEEQQPVNHASEQPLIQEQSIPENVAAEPAPQPEGEKSAPFSGDRINPRNERNERSERTGRNDRGRDRFDRNRGERGERRDRNDRDRGERGDRRDRRNGKFRRDRNSFDDRKSFEERRSNFIPPYPFTEQDIPDLLKAEDLARIFSREIFGSDYNKFSSAQNNNQDSPGQDSQISIAETQESSVIREEVKEEVIENNGSYNSDIQEVQEIQYNDNSENNIIEQPGDFDEEPTSINEERENSVSRMQFYKQYKIQEVIKRNQVVLVQVVKEERGTKGASLTTYLALAGRYCVFMPNTEKGGGVSRRISSFSERKRIRSIVKSLDTAKGSSLIIRTAGMERDENDIRRDYEYLMNIWEGIKKQTLESTAPALVYEESDIVKRSIRDLFKGDVEEVIIEGRNAYESAARFVEMTSPHQSHAVKNYHAQIPLFQKFKIEDRLDELYEREIKLESGGSIVITPTEALVSIDVNSGKSTKERNVEDTAYRTNIEAAREIARQLRLRDLAGLVVIDFIDMRELRNRKAVERELKDALRSDRAKIQIGRISTFGLLEMSRQRIHSSLVESSSQCCPMCNGLGAVRSPESLALKVIRSIEAESGRKSIHEIYVRASSSVSNTLKQRRARDIDYIQKNDRVKIIIEEDTSLLPNQFEVSTQKGGKKKSGSHHHHGKETTSVGLTLEEFEANHPESSGNTNTDNSKPDTGEVERSQYGEENQRSENRRNDRHPRDDRNYKGNRNKRRDRRGGRNFRGDNDNRGERNGAERYDRRDKQERERRFDEGNNQPYESRRSNFIASENQQNPREAGSDDKNKSSSKLLGLWKKITS